MELISRYRSIVLLMQYILAVSGVTLTSCCAKQFNGQQSSPDSTLTRVLKDKQLRVGYINYPPFTFPNPQTRKLEGLFVDTLSAILKDLDPGIQVTYEETTWADFGSALNTKRIDLSIAGTFATIPRAKVVSFTRPLVYLGRSVIIRKADGRFSGEKGPLQFDRGDIKVGVVDGEGSHEFVKANFKNLQNVTVFSGSDLSQCLAAVSSGQVDVGMSDAMETAKYAKSHSEVIDLFAAKPYDLTPIAWAVRHEDVAWRAFLDTALNLFDAQGKLQAFEQRYEYRWGQPFIDFRRR